MSVLPLPLSILKYVVSCIDMFQKHFCVIAKSYFVLEWEVLAILMRIGIVLFIFKGESN